MVESLHDQRPIRMASPTARLMGWTVDMGGDPLPSNPIIIFCFPFGSEVLVPKREKLPPGPVTGFH